MIWVNQFSATEELDLFQQKPRGDLRATESEPVMCSKGDLGLDGSHRRLSRSDLALTGVATAKESTNNFGF